MSDKSSIKISKQPKLIGPFDHLKNPKIKFISINDVNSSQQKKSEDSDTEDRQGSETEQDSEPTQPPAQPQAQPPTQPPAQPPTQESDSDSENDSQPAQSPTQDRQESDSDSENDSQPKPEINPQKSNVGKNGIIAVNSYYQCHKCQRKFYRQSDFIKHLGAIKPCFEPKDISSIRRRISSDYQKQLDKLEYEIKDLQTMVKIHKIPKNEKLKKYNKLLETYKTFAGYTRIYAIDDGEEDKYESELQKYLNEILDIKTKL